MIRHATLDDLPALIALGEVMHAESRFRTIRFVPEKLAATLTALIGGMGCVLVAEHDGQIIGGFAGAVVEYFFSTERMATDLGVFVTPDKRGGIIASSLIKSFIEWGRSQGARNVEICISTGVHVEKTGALLECLGLKRQGQFHVMEL